MQNSTGMSSLSTALLVGVVLLSAGCARFEGADKLTAKGQESLSAGDARTATIHLKNALQKQPDYAPARYLLGLAYLRQGEAANAEKELERASELKHDPNAVLPALCEARLLVGKVQAAVDVAGASLGAEPAARLAVCRGNAMVSQRKFGDAQAAFADALTRVPDLAPAVLGQAAIKLRTGDYAGARELTDKVLAKNAKDIEALLLAGDIAMSERKPDQARLSFDKVLAERGNEPRALFKLAGMAAMGGDTADARKRIDALAKASPKGAMAPYLLAIVELRERRLKEAREAINNALRLQPGLLAAEYLAASIDLASGETNQAQQRLQRVVSTAPQWPQPREMLARVYASTGDLKAALDALQPLIGDVGGLPGPMLLAAQLYFQTGDQTRAAQLIARAERMSGGDAQAMSAIAAAKFATGRDEEGLRYLENATQQSNAPLALDALLVVSLVSKKDFKRALDAVASMQKRDPKSAVPHNLRGAVQLAQGDFALARRSFDEAAALDPGFLPAVVNLARLDNKEKGIGEARTRLRAFAGKNPNNADALIELAGLYASGKGADMAEVTRLLNQAAQLRPDNPQPHVILARVALTGAKHAEAIQHAKRALELAPANADALRTLAAAQSLASDHAGAIATFERLLNASPSDIGARAGLAKALAANGNAERARSETERTLKMAPSNVDAVELLVRLDLADRRYDSALDRARTLQRDPKTQSPGFTLEGEIWAMQEKHADAIRAFEKVHMLSPSSGTATRLAGALQRAGRAQDAERVLAKWEQGKPADPGVALFRAELAMAQRDWAAAQKRYEQLAQQNPANALVRNNLAWVMHQQGDPKAAAEAEAALKVAPTVAAILDTAGWIYLGQGNVPRALELLSDAAAKGANNPQIRWHYAQALMKDGKKERARAEADAALKIAPTPLAEEIRTKIGRWQ